MSHVDFKKWQRHMALSLIFPNVTCRIKEKAMSHVNIIFGPGCMLLSPISHVEFKKWPCRPVDFRGQGPFFTYLMMPSLGRCMSSHL